MRKKALIVGKLVLAIVLCGATACSSGKDKADVEGDLVLEDQNGLEVSTNEWSTEEFLVKKETKSNISEVVTKVNTDLSTYTVIVNKMYPISSDYVPKDMVIPNVDFSFNFADEKRYLVKEAAEALEKLFAAAHYYGHELLAASGYRSYSRQTSIYDYNLLKKGYDYTNLYSARPGRSEHQTGLAMDITTYEVNKALTDKFGETEAGKWVTNNCYKYGFIIRYPRDKEDITGYAYEPWHLRYLGYDLAKYLYDEGLTLEEYYGCVSNGKFIEREQLAYYDKLLSSNKKGSSSNISKAVKDDIIEESQVSPIISKKPTSSPTKKPWRFEKKSTKEPEVTSTPEPEKTVEPQVSTKKPEKTSEPIKKEPTKEPTKEATKEPAKESTPVPEQTQSPSNHDEKSIEGNGEMKDIF